MTDKRPKQPFYLIDTSHPFYKPLWKRIAIVAASWAWAGLELYIGTSFFMVIACAIAVYTAWVLIVTYEPPAPPVVRPPDPEEDEDDRPDSPDSPDDQENKDTKTG